MRRSHTQPLPKGAYAAAECDEENVLRATPMRRLIKEVLAKVKADMHPEGDNPRAADRVTGDALDVLCRGAEKHLQEMFELGVIATQHTGRTTIKPEVDSITKLTPTEYSHLSFRFILFLGYSRCREDEENRCAQPRF